MGHKVYVSFKTEDLNYKEEIQSWAHFDYVDKSLNSPINSNDSDYILRTIRESYLRDSTVTVFLIGSKGSEDLGELEQQYIKGELQASLYDSGTNSKSGILGIVLPEMTDEVFGGTYDCSNCGGRHQAVNINDRTVIKEFSYNYYIPNNKCAWAEDDRYCVLVSWDAFCAAPNEWIDMAFDKRSAPIASKTKARP